MIDHDQINPESQPNIYIYILKKKQGEEERRS